MILQLVQCCSVRIEGRGLHVRACVRACACVCGGREATES